MQELIRKALNDSLTPSENTGFDYFLFVISHPDAFNILYHWFKISKYELITWWKVSNIYKDIYILVNPEYRTRYASHTLLQSLINLDIYILSLPISQSSSSVILSPSINIVIPSWLIGLRNSHSNDHQFNKVNLSETDCPLAKRCKKY